MEEKKENHGSLPGQPRGRSGASTSPGISAGTWVLCFNFAVSCRDSFALAQVSAYSVQTADQLVGQRLMICFVVV